MAIWQRSTHIGSYGGRLMPEEDKLDFPDDVGGGNLQITIWEETLKFWNLAHKAVSWDDIPDDLLQEFWLD